MKKNVNDQFGSSVYRDFSYEKITAPVKRQRKDAPRASAIVSKNDLRDGRKK